MPRRSGAEFLSQWPKPVPEEPSDSLELFRELDHVGDLAIEVVACERAELFRRALCALARLMVEADDIRPTHRHEIVCEALNDVDLIHDLLARALNLFFIENFVWCSAEVEEQDHKVKATLLGEPFDRARHRLVREIKAVTYHRLVVENDGSRWRAQIIFDI